MDMKNISNKLHNYKVHAGSTLGYKNMKEGFVMLKLLAKVAEKYARSTNTACFVLGFWHQPKMPASLIKKD